jgi:hypothetical protein
MMTALSEWIRQRVEAGETSARKLHAELTAPGISETSATVQDQKSAEQRAFESRALAVASELVAIVAPNVPEANRLAVVSNLTLPQIAARIAQAKASLGPADAAKVSDLVAEAIALFVVRSGYGVEWPPAADIGQATKPRQVVTRSSGPALFEAIGIERPTVQQIRELME